MVNGIRTIYSHGLNKALGLNFCGGSQVQHETPEKGRKTHWLKHCEYNNGEEDNNPITLSDKKKIVLLLFEHIKP